MSGTEKPPGGGFEVDEDCWKGRCGRDEGEESKPGRKRLM